METSNFYYNIVRKGELARKHITNCDKKGLGKLYAETKEKLRTYMTRNV
jgi:hypothetical protein